MTQKQSLETLLVKIEAGEWENDGTSWLFGNDWPQVFEAFNGSLDAAHALHKAVVPRFKVTMAISGHTDYGAVQICRPYGPNKYVAFNDNPARAWLIAIIKALIAECEE